MASSARDLIFFTCDLHSLPKLIYRNIPSSAVHSAEAEGSEEEILVIKGIVMVQWTFIGPSEGLQFIFNTCLSGYIVIPFTVVIPAIQRLAIGADPI